MKNKCSVIKTVMCLCAWLFCLLPSSAADTWSYPKDYPDNDFGGGNGSIGAPYLIRTAQDLADFAYMVNHGRSFAYDYVALAANITLNDITFGADNKPTNLSDLKAWPGIGEHGNFFNDYFCGDFDGRGHTISGLYIDTSTDTYTGLFGVIGCAVVHDIIIKNSYMYGAKGNSASGLMAGYMKDSFMYSCHISDSHVDITADDAFSGMSAGGFVGQGSGEKKLADCSFNGTVTLHHIRGYAYVGGIMGMGAPDLVKCRVDGDMHIFSQTSYTNDEAYVSGLCKTAASVTECVNNCTFHIGSEGNDAGEHQLHLNTLCHNVNEISRSANLGDIVVSTTNGWFGTVGNIGEAESVTDCAFYGSARAPRLKDSTTGKITFNYLGDEWGSLESCKRNVFLSQDGHPFSTSDEERFNADMTNANPGKSHAGVISSDKGFLTTDDLFKRLNAASADMYVWGKAKGVSTLIDGCPLPVACGGALDSGLMGEGTQESPWLIGSEAELRQLAEEVNSGSLSTRDKYFALTADIDMSYSEVFEPIGNKEANPFCGNFDGRGHVISGIRIRDLALFGYVSNCTVKRLAIVGAEFQNMSQNYGAVLLGRYTYNGFYNTVTDCYIGGDITINSDKFNVAPFVSYGTGTTVKNCYFKGRFIVGSDDKTGKKAVSGIVANSGYSAKIDTCYASFSVAAPDGVDIAVAGISGSASRNVKDCYSVCSQINQHNSTAEDDAKINGTICNADSEVFAGCELPSDSPWMKGLFRYVLSDVKHYVATAADGSDTEVIYDAIPLTDSSRPSNDIQHYTLKDGELNDKLLWALPNLAIYNPTDNQEYIINCTLDPTKPLNYNQKKGITVWPKVNMRYPLALETGKTYYPLCLPGTVHSDNFPAGSALYILNKVQTDTDGSRYSDVVRTDSVPYGIPFVAYIPNAKTGETVNVVMRSRMALVPQYFIIDKQVALTGTFKGGTVSDICTSVVEDEGRQYLCKAEGEQTVLPFTAYLTGEEKVELRSYQKIDELSKDNINVINDNNGKSVNTILKRTFAKGKWNTLVLPFDIDAAKVKELFGEGVKVAEYSNTDNSDIYFKSSEEGIKANVPVLIKPAAVSGDDTYTLYNVTFVSGTPQTDGFNYDFVGSYEPYDLVENDYMLYGDKWWRTGGGDRYKIKAFRAYIRANAGTDAVKQLNLVIDGRPTGLTLDTMNGNVEGKAYNMAGQRVADGSKGIVISDGKKTLRK